MTTTTTNSTKINHELNTSTNINNITIATTTTDTVNSYVINDDDLKPFWNSLNDYFYVAKDSEAIKEIIELVPQKVYKITFFNGKSVKTILEKSDIFNPEYMLFLAYAKMLYSKTLTFEGVLNKSYQLQYEKRYIKLVKNGLKLFKKIQEDKKKKEEEKEIKKRKREKLVAKKIATKKRKREDKINLIAEAIRRSKEED